MLQVGITGNIGSGKSTVSKLFSILGVPVYNADLRGRHITQHNEAVVEAVKELFGAEIYEDSGKLKRAEVGKIVFSDKEKLNRLNAIIHPAVAQDAAAWNKAQEEAGAAYSLKEAAIMIENKTYLQLDKLIVVSASKEVRLARVIKRDNTDSEQILARMKNQLSDLEKEAVADFIIDNNGELPLIPQVMDLHEELLRLSQLA